MAIETRELLADSYRHWRRATLGTMLTHAVEVDEQRHPVRVLCGRIRLDSVADPEVCIVGTQPTCVVCARRARAEAK